MSCESLNCSQASQMHGDHMDGVPLTDTQVDDAGTGLTGVDYQQFKQTALPELEKSLKDNVSAEDREQFARFSYANWAVGKALPGLQSLSDDERASVMGELGKAAMEHNMPKVQQILDQYGAGGMQSGKEAQQLADLVSYGSGAHDNFGQTDDWLHGIVNNATAQDKGFALNHFTHLGTDASGSMIGFAGAGENARQDGTYQAFEATDTLVPKPGETVLTSTDSSRSSSTGGVAPANDSGVVEHADHDHALH
jgi:hypothetical protein